MTPRQFALLQKRHRERLIHEEMVGGFITAAVTNGGFCRPENSVSPLDYMPNHNGHAESTQSHKMTDEELQIESDINIAALRLRLQWKAEQESKDDKRPRRAKGKARRS